MYILYFLIRAGPPPPHSGNARKKTFFFRGGVPLFPYDVGPTPHESPILCHPHCHWQIWDLYHLWWYILINDHSDNIVTIIVTIWSSMRRKRRRIRGEAPCRELPLPSVTGGSETQHFTPAGIILSAREKKRPFCCSLSCAKFWQPKFTQYMRASGRGWGWWGGRRWGGGWLIASNAVW